VPALESTSKIATAVSVFLILLLQLAIHPDMTWGLRGACVLAFAIGWFAARRSEETAVAVWVLAAPLMPALVKVLAHREGPVAEAVWMAGLAGAVLPAIAWTEWSLPRGWRPLAGGSALVVSLAWPIMVLRESGFHLARLADTGAVNSWSMPPMSAPQVAGWTLQVALTQLLGLLWLDWLRGRPRASGLRAQRPLAALWIGATAASLVAIYQGTIDLEFLNGRQWILERRASGSMLDGNAYGICAALAGPVAFAAVRAWRWRHASLLAWAILIVNLAGMWMAGSRTALLGAVISVGATGLAWWTSTASPSRRTMAIVGAGAAAIAVAVFFAATAIGPVRRLLETPLTLTELLERRPYGPLATAMLRDYPLTGVGLGGYHVISADYWHPTGQPPIPWDNAQNWWRHEAAELGLLGVLPLYALCAAVAWLLVRGRARSGERTTAAVARGGLVSMGLVSLFGVPTQNPLLLLWFFAFLALLIGAVENPDVPLLAERSRGAWLVVAALAIAFAAVTLANARGSLAVASRAVRWQREYIVGTYPPERLEQQAGEFRWTRQDAHFVWPATTRWLLIRVWAHHPDIASRPVRATLSTRCGPLLDEMLRTPEPVTIGIPLPEGETAVEADLHVSRTWRPASYGEADRRDLGVGITARFLDAEALSRSDVRIVRLPACTV
jgi:hypothetical protein